MLPANLPSVASAKIPATYKAAKEAITHCAHIDECQDWADKAEALASYAKQAEDGALRQMADRIQARAIRRCGELLKAMTPAAKPGNPYKNQSISNGGGAPPITRKKAAEQAGLSRDQRRTAIRIANVPEDDFNQAIESEDPPTVTELAERGKRPAPAINLRGRNPEEFKVSTQAQGQLKSFAAFLREVDQGSVVRGALPNELGNMIEHARFIAIWLEKLGRLLEKAKDKE